MRDIPPEIVEDVRKAKCLEWWTLVLMGSVILVMFFVAGSSQAMKTALIEDVLSLIPAAVFLIAAHFEGRGPTKAFPFGFHRVQSLASLIAAVALATVGAVLLFEASMTLLHQEHATIPMMNIFGHEVWMGWVMVMALVYSVIPPVILGHIKVPIARRLEDETLDTDAKMQRADWQTGLAGIAGVIGLGLGYWWADAAAAALISLSILRDGIGSLKVATAELIDGTPRALGSDKISDEAEQLCAILQKRYPGAEVRLRETGRFMHAQVEGVEPDDRVDLKSLWPGDPRKAWRLRQLSFVARPPDEQKRRAAA